MKKLSAILLSLCLLLTLAACGGDGSGAGSDSDSITIMNGLYCGIEDIFIVPAGAESWGEDTAGYVDPGVGAYWYPDGLNQVDVQFVDEYSNAYEFYGLGISPGDSFELSIDSAGDALLTKNGKDTYVGATVKGKAFADISSELDVSISELYVFPADSSDRGDPVATDMGYLEHLELSLTALCGRAELLSDIVLADEYGDSYIFEDVALTEGSEYYFSYDELGKPVLVNFDSNREYSSDRLEGGASDHLLSDLEGVWDSPADEAYVLFYGDLTWDIVSYEGEITASGNYDFLGREIIMYIDGEALSLRWSGDTELTGEDGSLSYVCSFDSPVYEELRALVASGSVCFEAKGYDINYEADSGGVYLPDMMAAYTEDGSFYETLPITMGVIIDSVTDSGDGFVEIVFTENVLLSAADYPSEMLTNNSSLSVTTVLCDYYTGYWLTEGSTTGNSSRGDNYYYYEYESQGRTVSVEYSYSTEWMPGLGGDFILSKQYSVRMPADYDGLVFVHAGCHPDYESYAAGLQSEPAGLGTVDDVRLETALICRIHSIG